MGLDTVELLMSIEEEFGINIPDEEVTCIYTMGQMRDYLEKHLRDREKVHCLSQRGFYILRRALMTTGGFKRNEIRPASEISRYLPQKGKRKFWQKLGEQTDCTLPDFMLHPLIRYGGLAVWMLISLLAFILLTRHCADLAMPVGCAVLVLTGALMAVLLLSLHKIPQLVVVRTDVATVGKLSDYIGRHLYDCRKDSLQGDVWERLCRLTADQAGVDVKQLTPETRFVNDLFP